MREVLDNEDLHPRCSKGKPIEDNHASEPQVDALSLGEVGGLGVEAHQEEQEAEVEGEEG